MDWLNNGCPLCGMSGTQMEDEYYAAKAAKKRTFDGYDVVHEEGFHFLAYHREELGITRKAGHDRGWFCRCPCGYKSDTLFCLAQHMQAIPAGDIKRHAVEVALGGKQ